LEFYIRFVLCLSDFVAKYFTTKIRRRNAGEVPKYLLGLQVFGKAKWMKVMLFFV